MNVKSCIGMFLGILGVWHGVQAKPLTVVTTTTTLASLVQEVAGASITVKSLAKGPQDPHMLEAKPSFVAQVRQADAVVSVGLDLESAWLGTLLRSSGKSWTDSKNHFVTGAWVDVLERDLAAGRSQGHVHPLGNPHYYLDPVRAKQVALKLAEHLSTLDASLSPQLKMQSQAFAQKMDQLERSWKERLARSQVSRVIVYHRTLSYFLDRFGIVVANTLEPKPGIPPSPSHLAFVMTQVKHEKIPCILIERYFDEAVAKKISDQTGARYAVVATEVLALPKIQTYADLIEHLVTSLETCASGRPHA